MLLHKAKGEPMTDEASRTDTAPEQQAAASDSKPVEEPFDAIAAVAELEAAMAGAEAESRDSGGSDRYIETLESEVLDLTALLETREAALARAEARAEQAQQEVEKAKVRLRAESAREIERRSRKVLLTFVEVLDELDRALSAMRQAGGADSQLRAGVEQVHRRFMAALEGYGVRHCPALGQPFDPTLHEAVTSTPTTDPEQDGHVVVVMREGYTVGEDELLRPAAVVVGKTG